MPHGYSTQMDEGNMCGLLFSLEKQANSAICDKVDEPGEHYVSVDINQALRNYCVMSFVGGITVTAPRGVCVWWGRQGDAARKAQASAGQ